MKYPVHLTSISHSFGSKLNKKQRKSIKTASIASISCTVFLFQDISPKPLKIPLQLILFCFTP